MFEPKQESKNADIGIALTVGMSNFAEHLEKNKETVSHSGLQLVNQR